MTLKRLCGGGFSLHHVLLLAASGLPPSLFNHFVEQLESFLFYYIFTKTATKQLERNFSVWADELRVIGKHTDATLQREALNTFVAERLQASMTAKEPELADAMRRYTATSMQQYRTRYLLAKLTQFVDMAYKGLKTRGWLHDYTTLEIEHILPQTPDSSLRATFVAASPEDAKYDEYKNKLGNLTLLEKPINIVASNGFFDVKIPEYRNCKCYLTSSIAGLTTVGHNSSINRINQKLQSFDEWSAASIDRRQELLIGLARDVWTTSPMVS